MSVQIRPLSIDDADDVIDLDQWAFSFSPEGLDPRLTVASLEWDRFHGAYRGGTEELAGIYGVYSLDLPVPGGALPAAGLTWVGVHPQYRRQGVLTAMMHRHLAQVRERGEAVSALNASEQPDLRPVRLRHGRPAAEHAGPPRRAAAGRARGRPAAPAAAAGGRRHPRRPGRRLLRGGPPAAAGVGVALHPGTAPARCSTTSPGCARALSRCGC